jgi:hypothetical protein
MRMSHILLIRNDTWRPNIKQVKNYILKLNNHVMPKGIFYSALIMKCQLMSLKTVEKWTLYVPITGLKSTLEKKSKILVYISPE